jgi:transposase
MGKKSAKADLKDANELAKENLKLKKEVIQLKKTVARLEKKCNLKNKAIVDLRDKLRIAKLPKNSSNSSRPPSTDLYKPERKKNLSLRVKSGKKPGGQPGHKGHTLAFCIDKPDEEIFHSPDTCSSCGGSLKEVEAEQGEVHQVIDISVPSKVIINHHSMIKRCSCGKCNKGTFPSGVKGMVNYGSAISALIANLELLGLLRTSTKSI